MYAFRGVARLILTIHFKTEVLKWMAVVSPFPPLPPAIAVYFSQGQIFHPVCGLEQWREAGQNQKDKGFFPVPRNWKIAQIITWTSWAFSQFETSLELLVRGQDVSLLRLTLSSLLHILALLFLIISACELHKIMGFIVAFPYMYIMFLDHNCPPYCPVSPLPLLFPFLTSPFMLLFYLFLLCFYFKVVFLNVPQITLIACRNCSFLFTYPSQI